MAISQPLKDWLMYWPLILNNQHPTVRVLFMNSISRFVNHAPGDDLEIQSSPFGSGALRMLLCETQELRTASVKVLESYIKSHNSSIDPSFKKKQLVLASLASFALNEKEKSTKTAFQMESIVELSGLISQESETTYPSFSSSLKVLVEFYCCQNVFIQSAAYNELQKLAKSKDEKFEVLLHQNLEAVSGPLATALINRPSLFRSIVYSLSYPSEADFLRYNIEFIMPYLIIEGHSNLLEAVSQIISERLPVVCIKSAHTILASIFLLEDSKMQVSLQFYLSLLTSYTKPENFTGKYFNNNSEAFSGEKGTNNARFASSQVEHPFDITEAEDIVSGISVISLLRSCSVKLVFELVFAIGDASSEISIRAKSALFMVIQTLYGDGTYREKEVESLSVRDVCTQLGTQSVNRASEENSHYSNNMSHSKDVELTSSQNDESAAEWKTLTSLQLKSFTQRCLLGVLACINELFDIDLSNEMFQGPTHEGKTLIEKQSKALLSLQFLFKLLGGNLKEYFTAIISTLTVSLKNPFISYEALETISVLVNSLSSTNLSFNTINSLISVLIELVFFNNRQSIFYQLGGTPTLALDTHYWNKVNDILVHLQENNKEVMALNWEKTFPIPDFVAIRGARSCYVSFCRIYCSKEIQHCSKSNVPSCPQTVHQLVDLTSTQSSTDDPIEIGFTLFPNLNFDSFYSDNFLRRPGPQIGRNLLYPIFSDQENGHLYQILTALCRLIENSDPILSVSACLEIEQYLDINYTVDSFATKLYPSCLNKSNIFNNEANETLANLDSKKLNATNQAVTSAKFNSNSNTVSNQRNNLVSVEFFTGGENSDIFDLLNESVTFAMLKHGPTNKHNYLSYGRLLGKIGLTSQNKSVNTLGFFEKAEKSNGPDSNLPSSVVKDLGLFNLFIQDEILDFLRHLIVNHFSSLFVSAKTPYKQLCLAFTIQEILKICGFSVVVNKKTFREAEVQKHIISPIKQKVSMNKKGYRENKRTTESRNSIFFLDEGSIDTFYTAFDQNYLLEVWHTIPESIRDLITPLLESKYRIEHQTGLSSTNSGSHNQVNSETETQTQNQAQASDFNEPIAALNDQVRLPTYSNDIQSSDPHFSSLRPSTNNQHSFFQSSNSFEDWVLAWLVSLIEKLPNNIVGKIFNASLSSIAEAPTELSVTLLHQLVLFLAHYHFYFERLGSEDLLNSFLFSFIEYLPKLEDERYELLFISEFNRAFKCSEKDLFYNVYIEIMSVFGHGQKLAMNSDNRSKCIKMLLEMIDKFQQYIRLTLLPPLVSAKRGNATRASIAQQVADNLVIFIDNDGSNVGKAAPSSRNFQKGTKVSQTPRILEIAIKGNYPIAQMVYGEVVPYKNMAISAAISGDFKRALLYFDKFVKLKTHGNLDPLSLVKFHLLIYIMLEDFDGISGCVTVLRHKGLDPAQIFENANNTALDNADAQFDIFAYTLQNISLDSRLVYRALDMGDWVNASHRYEAKLHLDPSNTIAQLGWIDCQQNMGQWEIAYVASQSWLKAGTNAILELNEQLADASAASAWRLGRWEDLSSKPNNQECSTGNFLEPIRKTSGLEPLPSLENAPGGLRGIGANQAIEPSKSLESIDRTLLFCFFALERLLLRGNMNEINQVDILDSVRLQIKKSRMSIPEYGQDFVHLTLSAAKPNGFCLGKPQNYSSGKISAKVMLYLHLLADLEQFVDFIDFWLFPSANLQDSGKVEEVLGSMISKIFETWSHRYGSVPGTYKYQEPILSLYQRLLTILRGSEICKKHQSIYSLMGTHLDIVWLQKMKAARLSDSRNAATSAMIQLDILNSVEKLRQTSSFTGNRVNPGINKSSHMSPIYYCLNIEKARVIYECGAPSQKTFAMNIMQSVMESILVLLVLNDSKVGSNEKERSNLVKACKAIVSSTSMSTLFPNVNEIIKSPGDSLPDLNQSISDILKTNIADLSLSQLQILRSNTNQLPEQDICQLQSIYVDAGVQLLEWRGDSQQVSSSSLLKQYEGILVLQDNLKAHYELGKQYDRLLVGILEAPTTKHQANKDKEQISKSSSVCTLRCRLILHFSRVCLGNSRYLYQSMARLFTVWLDFGKLLSDSPSSSNTGMEDKFETCNNIMANLSRRIPSYNALVSFSQIVSYICHPHPKVVRVLEMFIRKVLAHYPHQALWQLLAVVRSNLPARAKRCSQILTKAESDPNVQKLCNLRSIKDQAVLLTECMLKLCNNMPHKSIKALSVSRDFPGLVNIGKNCQLIIPIQSSLIPSFPSFNQSDISYPVASMSRSPSNTKGTTGIDLDFSTASKNTYSGFESQGADLSQVGISHSAQSGSTNFVPFPHELPLISGFLDEILVMSSLQRPKKITIMGSDGKVYPFLCKPKDDLRKDSRLMEFNALINQALLDDSESHQRSLSIKTYAVVPLNEECGLIQWVPHTISMQHVTLSMYRESNNPISMSSMQTLLNTKTKNPGQFFVENVLKKYPPVLYKWFMKKFNSPEEWFASRNTFARSAAVMSMVGYVIGLGDRHCENILLHEKTGQVVHVDFNCLFEKGLTLEVPELVPFRLTHNMDDAMGPTGFEGPFRKSCEIAMRLLRTHREALMSILDSFVHDPLVEWSSQRTKRGSNANIESKDLAGIALFAIRGKLAGLFNNAQLSVTGHVDELIKEATSPAKLFKMYIGWAPYL